jgi:RNA polymerase sigma-70 factor (family 1)
MAEVNQTVTKLDISQEFDAVFRMWYPVLCRYAISILASQAEAEDLVQQVFLKLWEKRNDLDINTSLKAYLYRMVHNACLNHMRSQKNKSTESIEEYLVPVESHTPERALTSAELDARIQNALQRLPKECRRIFELNRFETLKYREIAEQLQISIKTVESQMGKALRILRTELSDYIVSLFAYVSVYTLFM